MGLKGESKSGFYTQVKQLGILTTIPVILFAGPAIGFVFGSWLDRKAGSYPWFLIIFVTLGFIAAGREVARLLKLVVKDDSSK